jgi:hypothetical protein
MCVPLSLLGSSSVIRYCSNEYTCNIKTVVGSIILCAVCVLSEESGQLVLHKISVFFILHLAIGDPVSLNLFIIHMNSSLFGIVVSWNLLFLQNHFSHKFHTSLHCLSLMWHLNTGNWIVRVMQLKYNNEVLQYEAYEVWVNKSIMHNSLESCAVKNVTVLAILSFMGQSWLMALRNHIQGSGRVQPNH